MILTKQQLEDLGKCDGDKYCEHCSYLQTAPTFCNFDYKNIIETALAYREMLEYLEWTHESHEDSICHVCFAHKTEGHKPNCELAKLLGVEE